MHLRDSQSPEDSLNKGWRNESGILPVPDFQFRTYRALHVIALIYLAMKAHRL